MTHVHMGIIHVWVGVGVGVCLLLPASTVGEEDMHCAQAELHACGPPPDHDHHRCAVTDHRMTGTTADGPFMLPWRADSHHPASPRLQH